MKKFFAVIFVLAIFLSAVGDDSDSEKQKPPPTESKSVEETKTAVKESKPQPLGEHWIKDKNEVYLWNPKPKEGETIEWNGGFVVDGGNKFADGEGITTWYLNGEVEQVDKGTFKHGQRHGHFTHQFFPSGNIDYSDWDNGKEIEPPKIDNATAAKQTFMKYHENITNKNYRAAYDILSYAQRERVGDFDSYVAGFKDTISNEVSDMKLTASDEDSCTFDYTIIVRNRQNGGNVKVQIFKGEVTMAQDRGKWYVRRAKSSKVDEQLANEAEKEQREILAQQQRKREENLAKTSAESDLKKITASVNGDSVKDYLETIQPFALANATKTVSGIIGPLLNGDNDDLIQYAMAMTLLAKNERSRGTDISREVAIYFESEAAIAYAYASMEGKGVIETFGTGILIDDLSDKQAIAEKKIRATAASVGADLSDYAVTEAVRRIVNFIKKL